jgi:hypothetical protein
MATAVVVVAVEIVVAVVTTNGNTLINILIKRPETRAFFIFFFSTPTFAVFHKGMKIKCLRSA